MSDFDVLPGRLATALEDAGYTTAEQVIEASDEELWAVKGISKASVSKIRLALRDPLDVALDPFRPVAEEFANLFKQDTPDSSVVLDINWKRLTAGDFRKLHKALSE